MGTRSSETEVARCLALCLHRTWTVGCMFSGQWGQARARTLPLIVLQALAKGHGSNLHRTARDSVRIPVRREPMREEAEVLKEYGGLGSGAHWRLACEFQANVSWF